MRLFIAEKPDLAKTIVGIWVPDQAKYPDMSALCH